MRIVTVRLDTFEAGERLLVKVGLVAVRDVSPTVNKETIPLFAIERIGAGVHRVHALVLGLVILEGAHEEDASIAKGSAKLGHVGTRKTSTYKRNLPHLLNASGKHVAYLNRRRDGLRPHVAAFAHVTGATEGTTLLKDCLDGALDLRVARVLVSGADRDMSLFKSLYQVANNFVTHINIRRV